jgi:hypothetical protein
MQMNFAFVVEHAKRICWARNTRLSIRRFIAKKIASSRHQMLEFVSISVPHSHHCGHPHFLPSKLPLKVPTIRRRQKISMQPYLSPNFQHLNQKVDQEDKEVMKKRIVVRVDVAGVLLMQTTIPIIEEECGDKRDIIGVR